MQLVDFRRQLHYRGVFIFFLIWRLFMNNTQKVLKNKHICEQATPNLGITQSSGLDRHAVYSRQRVEDVYKRQRQYAGDQLVYIGEAIKVDPIKIGHQLQLLGVVVFEGFADHILFRAHLTGHLIIAKGGAAVIDLSLIHI